MWNRRTIYDFDGKKFVIDTSEIPERLGGKYETMIFHARKDGSIKNYKEVFCKRYDSERSAEVGHEQVVKDADRILSANLGANCH